MAYELMYRDPYIQCKLGGFKHLVHNIYNIQDKEFWGGGLPPSIVCTLGACTCTCSLSDCRYIHMDMYTVLYMYGLYPHLPADMGNTPKAGIANHKGIHCIRG